MSKKHDDKLTPEEEQLAAEMNEDLKKLVAGDDIDDPKPPKAAAKDADYPIKLAVEEEEPARFRTGGATASEIAAWREAHGVAPPTEVYAPGESEGGTPD